MREIATAVVSGPNDLIVGQTTVVTVCLALMIWLGLLGRPSRATLLWTCALALALLGSYVSLASASVGAGVLVHPLGVAISSGMPLLIRSGLRAAQGKHSFAWTGFAQSLLSVLLLTLTSELEVNSIIFRWIFFLAAVSAALGAVEVLYGAFRGSRFGIPLVVASGILLLLGTVGLVGSIGGTTAEADLLFVRGVVIAVTVYTICATVSLLFLANRRPGADILESVDAFMPEPLMRAVVRERLLRADARREQNWSFIDLRLDDATDLREATGDAAFSSMVRRFEALIVATLPAETDLGRVSPGHALVFASQPTAAVREFVRTVINEVSAPHADAPTSLRISASAAIVAVDPGSDTFESLVARASEAAGQAQADGGNQWRHVDTRSAPARSRGSWSKSPASSPDLDPVPPGPDRDR